VAKKFLDNYFTKYGEFPDGYAAEGYEALGLIVFAFDTCGKDYNCIQNYLLTLKDHNSIFSNMSFDANGDVYYDLILKTIKEGKFVNYEE
jgi:branched-chain amino acid transport system substrate-binding protein